jgi:alpha-methylacyl-CoA racemase
VDVSLFASAVAWLPALIGPLFQTGTALRPGEPILSGGLAQYGVYATADARYVTLGALEPKFLANFLQLDCVGRPELTRASQQELRAALTEIFAQRTLDEWVLALDGVDTCFAPVNTLEEAMRDPQVQALRLIGDGQLASPFAMSRTPATIRRAPPKLGEHNAEIAVILREPQRTTDPQL